MRVLMTGTTGFVGACTGEALVRAGHDVRCAVRRSVPPGACADVVSVGEIGPETSWDAAVAGVDCVIHLAARVHQMGESADPTVEKAYRDVNVLGAERLARCAARSGVRRLVFVSTVKVNGDERPSAYREADDPHPGDVYARSKREAEQALSRIAAETGLELVVVRPPLVYGPGVKANMLRMFEAIDRGLPLPLGRISNQRSLVYVGNLADALVACTVHPRAANRTFLVSDGRDLSTTELARMIAGALGRPARLVPVPPSLIRVAAGVLGRGDAAKRLLGSLTVDIGRIRSELEWRPPFSIEEGLRQTAAWFRGRRAAQP